MGFAGGAGEGLEAAVDRALEEGEWVEEGLGVGSGEDLEASFFLLNSRTTRET